MEQTQNKPVHRQYFLALLCPLHTDKRVSRYKQWMKEQFSCTVAMKSPAHITIIPPFWWPEEKEPELMALLDGFSFEETAVTTLLDGFSHFDKRTLFIGVKPPALLDRFHRQALAYFGTALGAVIQKDKRPFHPHVTIATRDMQPAQFDKAWEKLKHEKFSDSFSVTALSLLKLSPGKWEVRGEKQWGGK